MLIVRVVCVILTGDHDLLLRAGGHHRRVHQRRDAQVGPSWHVHAICCECLNDFRIIQTLMVVRPSHPHQSTQPKARHARQEATHILSILLFTPKMRSHTYSSIETLQAARAVHPPLPGLVCPGAHPAALPPALHPRACG